MRRRRLRRDREFAGMRVLANRDARDGHQLDDFLDKNRIPHRLVEFESEQGQALGKRFHLTTSRFAGFDHPGWCAIAQAVVARSRPGSRLAAVARGRK